MDVGAAPADISFPSSDIITGWPASPAHLLCAQLGDSLLFQELPIGQSVRLAQLDGLDSDRWLSNLAAQ
jgi:hypothetical protein